MGDSTPSQLKAGLAKAGVSITTNTTGDCVGIGCWYVLSNTAADYNGSGSYGWGTTYLGEITLLYQDNLTGGQASTTKPFQFSATSELSGALMSGERMYYSAAYPGGTGDYELTLQAADLPAVANKTPTVLYSNPGNGGVVLGQKTRLRGQKIAARTAFGAADFQ